HRVEEKYYPGVDHVGTLLAIGKPLRRRAPVVDDIANFFAAN
ncbi:MAG: alpha/beta hydrolase, partial [Pseudaminobacter sp.]|nr:alpha/beta hydrolase [Pseudaminobacter sp.]